MKERELRRNPRISIERMIDGGDMEGLLRKAAELHGHFCPFLTLGVRAGYRGVKSMRVKTKGMEEFLAILETNNCFSDGVQMVSGCSFGNNSLVYRDFGKTAASFVRRDGKGVRVIVRVEDDWLNTRYPEAAELFMKVVVKREGSEEEEELLRKEWQRISFDTLNYAEEELFQVEDVEIAVPDYAPMYNSVFCAGCGESVMESRVVKKEGRVFCIPCSGERFHQLDGSGISLVDKGGEP